MKDTDKMMKKILLLASCILLTLSVGGVSGYFTVAEIAGWYSTLHKPSFNPPNYVFGPVWTCLYLLMGISFYLVLTSHAAPRRQALVFFWVQLIFNFFWSLIFFNMHQVGLALVDIVLMWLAILGMIITFYKINKVAALMQLPYLAWVSFATCLNAAIWMLN